MEDLRSILTSTSDIRGAQICTAVSDISQNTTTHSTSTASFTTSNIGADILTSTPAGCRQRRSKHEVFDAIYDEVSSSVGVNRRKNVSQLSRPYYNAICDRLLCYLLCIAGYNCNNTTLPKNSECFCDVMTILSGVKARLMRRTQLTETLAAATNADTNGYDGDNNNEEILPPLTDPPPGKDNDAVEQEPASIAKKLQSSLIADLSRTKYNKNIIMINQLNNDVRNKQLSSHYKLAKDLPVVNDFFCRYREGDPETLELDSDGEEIIPPTEEEGGETGDNVEKIITCDGEYVDLKDCVDMMLKKLNVS